jgi:hypothetical protein
MIKNTLLWIAQSLVAAIGVVILMICAGIFHLTRGEAVIVNIVFAIIATFIAWGRLRSNK